MFRRDQPPVPKETVRTGRRGGWTPKTGGRSVVANAAVDVAQDRDDLFWSLLIGDANAVTSALTTVYNAVLITPLSMRSNWDTY